MYIFVGKCKTCAEKRNLLRSFRVDTDSHPPDHDGDITEEFDDLQLDDDE